MPTNQVDGIQREWPASWSVHGDLGCLFQGTISSRQAGDPYAYYQQHKHCKMRNIVKGALRHPSRPEDFQGVDGGKAWSQDVADMIGVW